MATPSRFLVVDDNADSRFLLVKTLLRKFPAALVEECGEANRGIDLARTETFSAIVTHRATDMPGLMLLSLLRQANAAVPIVMVSGVDRSSAALEAGATGFLLYEEWLKIGSVVADLLRQQSEQANAPTGT